MFSKLLKHEWKANAGLLGILSLCALGAGLLGGLVLRGIVFINERNAQGNEAVLGTMGLSSALMFIIVALIAYAFAVQFINLFRFYKNKFTDEGYLTFTLPVSPSQIFLSSFLNVLAWLAISAVVLAVAFGLLVFIGAFDFLLETGVELQPLFWGLFGILDEAGMNQQDYVLYCILSCVSVVVTAVYSVLLLMTSITVGCVLARKHKILVTVGIYYAINFAIGIVESILGVVPLILLGMSEGDFILYMNATAIINIILRLGLGIGGYFLSTHLMKRKLNLP